MKNKKQEWLRSQWKTNKRDYFNHEGWLYIPHCYDGTKKQSWWDDFSFKTSGNKVVSVCWIHPRMSYQDKCEEKAFSITQEQGYSYKSSSSLFVPSHYKKVGKSRKKIQFYTMRDEHEENNTKYFDKCNENELIVKQTGDVEAKPFVYMIRTRYGILMEICFPVELLTEQSVICFASNIKFLYENNMLVDVVKSTDYLYNKDMFNKEF